MEFGIRYILLTFLFVVPSALANIDTGIIQSRMSKLVRTDHLSGTDYAVAFIKGNEIKAENYSDNRTSVDKNSIFRIASLTKTFTALAIYQLAAEGRISFNDKLSSYIPELKDKIKEVNGENEIELIHLLTHISGLPRRADGSDFEVDITELIEMTKETSFPFKVAENYGYSNIGFALLGEIISRVTKEPYEKYIFENILTPLNMTNTYFHETNIPNKKRLIAGFTEKGDLAYKPDLKGHASGWGMFSTIADLSKYVSFLTGSLDESFYTKVLSRANLELMMEIIVPFSDKKGVGASWQIEERNGKRVIRHGGLIDGFESEFLILPELKMGFIILSNTFGRSLTNYMNRLVDYSLTGRDAFLKKPERSCYSYFNKEEIEINMCF